MNKMKGICLQAHDAHSRNIIMYFIEIVFLWEMTEAWFWYQKKNASSDTKRKFCVSKKKQQWDCKKKLEYTRIFH